MLLEDRLRAVGSACGLSAVGFCAADSFPDVERSLVAAVDSGRSARLSFTFRDPATASRPQASFPWAASLVVTAHAYLPQAGAGPAAAPGLGRVARFATGDNYDGLRTGLEALADELRRSGHRAEIVFDDNRLVDRAAAVRAGIAWWGKSTMVLAPGVGPWVLLGSVVTDADLTYDEPMRRGCGTCDACIPACPTGAIVAPGILDARRCLAAIAQSAGAIPLEFRRAMGDRVYGCDECLTACPPGQRLEASATTPAEPVDLIDLLATADRPLRQRYAHFYVPRNQARFLRRNAIVALGNAGGAAAVGVLAGLLGHPDSLLRLHAAWALGRLGGPQAEAVLAAGAAQEADPEVAAEIDAALGSLG